MAISLQKEKGGKDIFISYCPISLTNVASKIMEQLVINSFTLHLESQGYFKSCQHGFRTGRSAVTNMLSCDSFIWQSLTPWSARALKSSGHHKRAFYTFDTKYLCN